MIIITIGVLYKKSYIFS